MSFSGSFPPSEPEPSGGPEILLRTPREQVPEDLRVPWGLKDLALFIAFAIAITLLIGFIVAVAFLLAGVSREALANPGRMQSLVAIVAQVVIDFVLLGYLALQIRYNFRAPFWQTIGWRGLDTAPMSRGMVCAGLIISGVVISFVVDSASELTPPKGPLPIEAVYQDRLTALLFLLMAVLLAPVVEETIFRGYIYPVLGRCLGMFWGIVITGTLFGLLHGIQLWGAWWQTGLLVVVGIIFTWLRALMRTVTASYLMHVGYNSFLFIGFLAATHGLKTIPH